MVVQRKTRAVLYIANRDNARLDALLERETLNAAHRLSIEIAVRDEVDRRLKLIDNSELPGCTEADIEVLREIHAELRSLTQRISDPTVRTRLRQISLNLASVWRGQVAVDPAVRLTPREIDVLSNVALGCSNKDTARRLSLAPETVKSYLRSAMSKLDAQTRYEAVVTARKLRILL
ncbi:helix-turn-helix transcriptional regulator [Rhodococcus qingshengii]|uniref:helix-turn-helix transcriptional regulator n=1 Tax=Rhodococcus TaxID=1827 RepID=UPI0027DBBD2E|nr:LuxR C-terminal-related transcriptional regulator [Rhodococcus qingshengii]